MTAAGPNPNFSNMSREWLQESLITAQIARRMEQEEITRLAALLERVMDYLYNPFEPDNQSRLYNDIRKALGK